MTICDYDTPPTIGITDRMTLHGIEFSADIVLARRPGDATALRGGRILCFHLRVCEETISYYSDGEWWCDISHLSNNEWYTEGPCSEREAWLAQSYFIQKWSKHQEEAYE